MNLIILKNGTDVVARTDDYTQGAEYSLLQVEELPPYPEIEAGFGKSWELTYDNQILEWKAAERELTTQEKLMRLEDAVSGLNILGVPNE